MFQFQVKLLTPLPSHDNHRLGPRDQCVWRQWCGGGQRLLQLELFAAACPLPAFTRGPGQPGDGGEHSVVVQLEGPVHGALLSEVLLSGLNCKVIMSAWTVFSAV